MSSIFRLKHILIDFKYLLNILRVNFLCLGLASLEFFVSIPVGGLREQFEAAPAWKRLLSVVRSQVNSHGNIFLENLLAGLTNQPRLEPFCALVTLPDHLVGGRFRFRLRNFF